MDAKHLEGQPLFAGLDKKQRALVAQHADELSFAAGRELITEGGLAWEFFVITDGTAEVRHDDAVVRSLGPGDFFGEIGVLSPSARRTASVVTTSPVEAIVMTAQALRSISHEMPAVADQLRAAISARQQS